MDNKSLRVLTRTAMLLALTLVFQNLRVVLGAGTHTQFIIGSLVNMALVVSAGIVNVYAGLVISIAAPVVAFLQGQLPAMLPWMIPIVAVGNILIVLGYALLKKRSKVVGIIAGAVAKWGFLFYAVRYMLNMVKGSIPDNIFNKISAAFSFTFSWPQLVTALIGGFVALLVIKALKEALKENIF